MTDIDNLAGDIHQNAREKGFWDNNARNYGEMLMLVTSELAEALEEHRASRPAVWFKHEDGCPMAPPLSHTHGCNCNPKPEGHLVEVADAIIRLLDLAESQRPETGWTISEVILRKMKYNASRERLHGKLY